MVAAVMVTLRRISLSVPERMMVAAKPPAASDPSIKDCVQTRSTEIDPSLVITVVKPVPPISVRVPLSLPENSILILSNC
jgi:hypothetical protein